MNSSWQVIFQSLIFRGNLLVSGKYISGSAKNSARSNFEGGFPWSPKARRIFSSNLIPMNPRKLNNRMSRWVEATGGSGGSPGITIRLTVSNPWVDRLGSCQTNLSNAKWERPPGNKPRLLTNSSLDFIVAIPIKTYSRCSTLHGTITWDPPFAGSSENHRLKSVFCWEGIYDRSQNRYVSTKKRWLGNQIGW